MSVISAIESKYKKPHVVDVKSGDSVRVHQKIREGNKERIQVFEGLVIRTKRMGSHTASIAVRRVASGIGVEKTYLLHSPLITKIEVMKRSKVRRNYLSYMRARTGKAARLASVDFDQEAVNKIPEVEVPKENKQVDSSEATVAENNEAPEEPEQTKEVASTDSEATSSEKDTAEATKA